MLKKMLMLVTLFSLVNILSAPPQLFAASTFYHEYEWNGGSQSFYSSPVDDEWAVDIRINRFGFFWLIDSKGDHFDDTDVSFQVGLPLSSMPEFTLEEVFLHDSSSDYDFMTFSFIPDLGGIGGTFIWEGEHFPSSAPEPGSLFLLGFGLIGFVGLRKKIGSKSSIPLAKT